MSVVTKVLARQVSISYCALSNLPSSTSFPSGQLEQCSGTHANVLRSSTRVMSITPISLVDAAIALRQ